MMLAAAGLSFLSTLAGGLVSLRYRDKFHVILGFTAGVLLGVVAFDILPEVMELVGRLSLSPRAPMVALTAGFFAFHIIEMSATIHHACRGGGEDEPYPKIGLISAAALTGHSFMDGVGIGLGFQVSGPAGLAVAAAVVAHDFCDGLNTGSLMLVHGNAPRRALALVLADAAAPVLGALSTTLFTLPPRFLALYLGFFAGFLLCIGTSDVLPEAYEHKLSHKPMVMAVLGAACVYAATSFLPG